MPSFKGLIAHCQEATLLSLKKEEKKLPFFSQLKLWLHLAYCASCRRFVKQSQQITGIASGYKYTVIRTPAVTLSEEKKAKLQNSINDLL